MLIGPSATRMSIQTLLACVSLSGILLSNSGCGYFEYKHRRPHITAYPASPLNQCEAPGIPFYMPKPLLVISKNFYHVEDAKVGLTGTTTIPSGFDDQATFGSVALDGSFSRSGTSNMQSSGAATSGAGADGHPSGVTHGPTLHSTKIPTGPQSNEIINDGLGPHMFFTYEVVFVPDLTQKYTLEINGGPGEIRAAMNLVNGWQFTGLGPYYMKDSSTAQNIMASGVSANLGLGGVSDVINSVANLRSVAGSGATISASDVAAIATAMDEARRERILDTTGVPTEAWGTRTVYHEDGTTETIRVPPKIERYAEISVYEASLEGDRMVWLPIANQQYDREFLGIMKVKPGQMPANSRRQGINLKEDPDAKGDESVGAATGFGAADSGMRQGVTGDSYAFRAGDATFNMLLNRLGQEVDPSRDFSGAAASESGFPRPQVETERAGPRGEPRVAASAYSDPELAKLILQQSLSQTPPKKRSLWDRLRCRSVQSNTFVDGTISE